MQACRPVPSQAKTKTKTRWLLLSCARCACAQISEKQLYEAEKQFKVYESMINVMTEEVRGVAGRGGARARGARLPGREGEERRGRYYCLYKYRYHCCRALIWCGLIA